MDKVLTMLITAALVLAPIYVIAVSTQAILLQQQNAAYAQISSGSNNTTSTTTDLRSSVHPDVDSSPIAAVIIIGEDMQGNVSYIPNNVTVKVGEEILIVNNGTYTQSVTNGMSPDDPLAGKLFDTGPIPPRGFAEYVAANLSPGNYTFYSTNSTSTTGVLTIEPNS
jgi:plastocyanin